MMPLRYTDVIATVPPGEKGVAKIVHNAPSAMDRLQGALHGQPLTRDKYCRLLVRGNVVMTDAEFERKTNIGPLINARGNALIAGLGIGLILHPLIARCESVTVIEKEADVISLVAPKYPSVQVINANILEWMPPKSTMFDLIYFDIWADICSDDLATARTLHRRFRKHLSAGGYMASWCRTALNYLR